jgi:hypothetical protein
MTWHVQYREGATDLVERYRSPENAIVAACRMLDCGQNVYGIGTGSAADMPGLDEIARIYPFRMSAKYLFSRVSH